MYQEFLQSDRLVVIFDRLFVVAQIGVGNPSVNVNMDMLGSKCDRTAFEPRGTDERVRCVDLSFVCFVYSFANRPLQYRSMKSWDT
ncbi:MAG: hypothetical protein QNJ41_29340 [Xenococcaceae cyanobacterium MO_188.B32]|nr:hypothetical protein [Xenococcaceae cyanobacterium MO_188.B32]